MFSNMPYDPESELTPVVIVSRLPHIFVVNAKVEAKTLKELVLPSVNDGLILAQPVRGFASMVQRKGLAMVRLK
jgi:tripartite-type tricarboxylate transporter receptor subunit TctC